MDGGKMKSLKTKILLGYGVILFCLTAIVGYSYISINHFKSDVQKILSDDLQLYNRYEKLNYNIVERNGLVEAYLLTGNPDLKVYIDELVNESKEYEEYLLSRANNEIVKEVVEDNEKWVQVVNHNIFSTFDSGDKEWAVHLFEMNAIPIVNDTKNNLNLMVKQLEKDMTMKGNQLIEQGNHLLTLMTVFASLAIILSVFTALLITNRTVGPIIHVMNQLKSISEGKLDLTSLRTKSKDEVGQLIKSLNQTVESLRTLIKQVNDASEQVASSSEELTAIAQENTGSTDHMANSIQQVATGVDQQVQSIDHNSELMKEMTLGIQQVASNAAVITTSTVETTKEAKLGNKLINQSISQMELIFESVNHSGTVIKRLGDHSVEINKIIEVITQISDQTNLLALNAAIEAARAGNAGKGFAVVADEVKKLALHSKQYADQIAKLIQSIQKDTHEAITVMEKGTEEVSIGITVINQTGNKFKTILSSIEEVSEKIQELSTISEQMSTNTQQVQGIMEEVAYIARVSSAEVQSVASTAEEQLASMEEIAFSATSLSKLSQELQGNINKFKI
jgi:methyl-accepting chemotaxis protein